MSTTEPSPTSLRHRKSVVIRKLDSELELLHTDQRKTAKQRWSACLAFIFKRSKLKSDSPPSHILSTSSSSSSLTTSDTATLPSDHLHSNNHGDIGNPISEKATYHYSVSLPPTPVSSLSPPPRHIMTRQNRTKSLTPMDQPYNTTSLPPPPPSSFSSTPILPISSNTFLPPPPPSKDIMTIQTKSTLVPQQQQQQQQRRRCIPRSSTLRLSLDVDQRYSYTSSLHSSDEIHDENGETDLPNKPYNSSNDITQYTNDVSSPDDSMMIRQQQQASTTTIKQWKPQHTQEPSFLLDIDHDFDDFDDDDDGESCSSRQIRKQKAHYEAVVTSTMYHHHRPCQEEEENCINNDNSNNDDNDDDDDDRPSSSSIMTKLDPFLDTPPSSAPLLKSPPSLTFPPLPSSPHSLASLDTPS